MSYEYLYRIVIMGDSAVGKTTFMNKYTNNKRFKNAPVPTVGIDFGTKIIDGPENRKIKVHLWDTSGNKNYRKIADCYFKGVAGAVVMYNVSCRNSFENLSNWVKEFRYINNDNHYPMFLLGADIGEKRLVASLEGIKFARENNMFFSEIDLTDDRESTSDILAPLWNEIWYNFIVIKKPCIGIKKFDILHSERLNAVQKPETPPPPPKPVWKRVSNELREHANDVTSGVCIIS
jgi:small GTP-binding protein